MPTVWLQVEPSVLVMNASAVVNAVAGEKVRGLTIQHDRGWRANCHHQQLRALHFLRVAPIVADDA